jgi:hypothetical protein
MSSHQPLLNNDIEPDEEIASSSVPSNSVRGAPVVLTPTNRSADRQMATNPSDAESGELDDLLCVGVC